LSYSQDTLVILSGHTRHTLRKHLSYSQDTLVILSGHTCHTLRQHLSYSQATLVILSGNTYHTLRTHLSYSLVTLKLESRFWPESDFDRVAEQTKIYSKPSVATLRQKSRRSSNFVRVAACSASCISTRLPIVTGRLRTVLA
jgi:hypothetical protein